MSVPSLFQPLGFSIKSVQSGVYHLQLLDEQGAVQREAVGLLYSDNPLTKETQNVKLFLQDVDDKVPAARIIYHWQTLDARRFEESGLAPLELTLTAAYIPEALVEKRHTRPDGVRIRHTVPLTTGEVVCYN